MPQNHALVSLIGRALMALIFIVAGWQKITGYDGTLAYMQSHGLPGSLLPLVILTELGGGLALLGGVFSRWAALLLALFSVATAVLFHSNFGEDGQSVQFMKNLAMAGGLLLVYANGPGAYVLKD